MPDYVSSLAQLGGTVATVVLFLWYLVKKDGLAKETADSDRDAGNRNIEIQAKNAETISKSIGKNTEVLSELSTNLALQKEAMKNICKAED